MEQSKCHDQIAGKWRPNWFAVEAWVIGLMTYVPMTMWLWHQFTGLFTR